jgi:hypothetical protein
MLDRNNKSLVISNGRLLQDNTLLHYKIGQTNRLIDIVVRKVFLRVKATMINNNVHKYDISAFIKNVAN